MFLYLSIFSKCLMCFANNNLRMFIFTFSGTNEQILSTATVAGVGVGGGIFVIALLISAILGEFWYVNILMLHADNSEYTFKQWMCMERYH